MPPSSDNQNETSSEKTSTFFETLCVCVFMLSGWVRRDVLRGQQKTYRGQTYGLKDNIKEIVAHFKAGVSKREREK